MRTYSRKLSSWTFRLLSATCLRLALLPPDFLSCVWFKIQWTLLTAKGLQALNVLLLVFRSFVWIKIKKVRPGIKCKLLTSLQVMKALLLANTFPCLSHNVYYNWHSLECVTSTNIHILFIRNPTYVTQYNLAMSATSPGGASLQILAVLPIHWPVVWLHACCCLVMHD